MLHLIRPAAVAAALCATMAAAPAFAADGDKVAIKYKDLKIDFGSLHISVNLLGYELAGEGGGLVSSIMGAYELGNHLMVRAQTTFPLLGFLNDNGPFRAEAGISFHSFSIDVENENIQLSSRREGDMIHTESINVPALNRNSIGLDAGLMYRSNDVEVKSDGDNVVTRGYHLTAYAGLSTINASGYSIDAQGHGGFSNYRWINGGLDALFDITQTYDSDPDDAPGRFGGRLWGESIFGQDWGLSGRLEIGYMPGDMGFYIMASVGGGFHLF